MIYQWEPRYSYPATSEIKCFCPACINSYLEFVLLQDEVIQGIKNGVMGLPNWEGIKWNDTP